MPKTAAKVAVSVPAGLYRAIEAVRKRTGQSRSAVVQEALRHWLRSRAEADLVRDYEAGYRRRPESRHEVAASWATAIGVFEDDDW